MKNDFSKKEDSKKETINDDNNIYENYNLNGDDSQFLPETKIEAKYKGKGTKWFSGIIASVNEDGTYKIIYDDGDIEDNAKAENIRLKKINFQVGMNVEVNYKGRGKWYPGVIVKKNSTGNFYTIDYDEGGHEKYVLSTNMRLSSKINTKQENINSVFKIHDRVLVNYLGKDKWLPGTIVRITNDGKKYSIDFDNGNYETYVEEIDIKLLDNYDNEDKEDKEDKDEPNKKKEVMSRVAYNYGDRSKSGDINIPGILPPPDDELSSMSDLSGNLVDSSGNKIRRTYRKFTYKEIEDEILNNYFDNKTKYSSALDILATYLRGQKLIYMESKSYCENKLNKLMMPSIFLSTAATVLSAIVKEFVWGAYLIASVNGIIAFLLAIVNYLKLDAASEAHKITAHQYDKLQTKIEFLSGKTLLFSSDEKVIEDELEGVKKKIEEIKETNQFIVPKKIRTLYPIMFNTNVFLIIKKIEDIRKRKINSIKEVKNQKNYLIEVMKSKKAGGKDDKIISKIESEIKRLQNERDRHINNILVLKSAFSIIDEMFMKEMENAEKYKSMKIRRWLCLGFGITDKITDPREINKFIEDVMNPYKDKIDEESLNIKTTKHTDISQLVNELSNTKKILINKRLEEHKRRKKTIKDLKKANNLLKDNVGITEQIYNKMEVYDKLERGEYDKINYEEDRNVIKLNKPKTIVKLFGIGSEEERINLKMHSDEERASLSGSDNSDPYMDFEVCKEDDEIN